MLLSISYYYKPYAVKGYTCIITYSRTRLVLPIKPHEIQSSWVEEQLKQRVEFQRGLKIILWKLSTLKPG